MCYQKSAKQKKTKNKIGIFFHLIDKPIQNMVWIRAVVADERVSAPALLATAIGSFAHPRNPAYVGLSPVVLSPMMALRRPLACSAYSGQRRQRRWPPRNRQGCGQDTWTLYTASMQLHTKGKPQTQQSEGRKWFPWLICRKLVKVRKEAQRLAFIINSMHS